MSNESKQRRKAIVQRLRAEGRQAFQDGRHIQNVPREYVGNMDEYQWLQGYLDAQREAQHEESQS